MTTDGVYVAAQKLLARIKELEKEAERLRNLILEEQVKWLIPISR
jgi:uncharacterized protein Yka (UPF0111/DUF47 family)